ncbi:MAG: trypsin-like peptidase domain-containing protein [Clostridium sp.]|nr:trypsin-like peptidase domain-containing protein [Clostridium sp.]
MEDNNNNMNRESGSMYHYGRNESPYSREDISGRTISGEETTASGNAQARNEYNQNANPYSQDGINGQGMYAENNFTAPEPEKKKRKKMKKARKSTGNGKGRKVAGFIASAAAFGLIAGAVMVGVNAIGNRVLGIDRKTAQIATVTAKDPVEQTIDYNEPVADVAENVMPSIVSITNTSVQTVRSWFQSYEQEVTGSGSGIIIGQDDDKILIVTNNHVIDGAKEITVAFCDETAVAATVKGADATADLAVLEVQIKDMEADTLSKIKVAALGSSDSLRVGQTAIAIGNALGYGQSVTVGYISAVDREVDLEDKTMTMLQTDATINPGNSGGALLNAKGEVIGINTVKYVDSTVEGMGYAIPISSAIPIINDLMNQEVIAEKEQGYLGIRGKELTEEYTQGLNMPKGVYVIKIVEGSPADECGLKAGDIITKFADRDVSTMETLQQILSTKKAGQEIQMVVQRNNEKGEYEEVTITVKLGAKKDMPDTSEEEETVDEDSQNQNPQQQYPEDFFDDFYRYFGE